MKRRNLPLVALLSAIAVATLTLAGCGGSSSNNAADRPVKSKTHAPEKTPNADGEPAETPRTNGPTGRLTLDGQTWNLTYDADDPNAECQIIAENTAIVSGMRTPNGNRVDLSAMEFMISKATATYFNDGENPVLAVSAEGSSKEPEWSFDGSTVRVKGLWFDLNDSAKPEVEGELEVTC